jgi:hypothetical protein
MVSVPGSSHFRVPRAAPSNRVIKPRPAALNAVNVRASVDTPRRKSHEFDNDAIERKRAAGRFRTFA